MQPTNRRSKPTFHSASRELQTRTEVSTHSQLGSTQPTTSRLSFLFFLETPENLTLIEGSSFRRYLRLRVRRRFSRQSDQSARLPVSLRHEEFCIESVFALALIALAATAFPLR